MDNDKAWGLGRSQQNREGQVGGTKESYYQRQMKEDLKGDSIQGGRHKHYFNNSAFTNLELNST